MADIGYFDGACEPGNPGGTGAWGYLIFDGDQVMKQDCGAMAPRPDMTNNVAEYAAAGAAVKKYRELGRPGPLLLRGDSKLVIEQMKGRWAVKGGAYVAVRDKLVALLAQCPFKVDWEWVPRERNQAADDLSKRALAEVGIVPTERHGSRTCPHCGKTF